MTDKFSHLVNLACSSFAIASLGGLAGLLRSKKPLGVRSVVAALLYSGVTGLISFLLLSNYCNDERVGPFVLLGISGMAGIGGVTLVDFLIQWWKNGLNININVSKQEPRND